MNPSIVTDRVLQQVLIERIAQDTKWGEQNHPDGTGYDGSDRHADFWRQRCQDAFADGEGTWGHVLLEEVFEAIAENDPAKLRTELVQVAAVAVAWIEALDRRPAAAVRKVVGHATVLETTNAYEAPTTGQVAKTQPARRVLTPNEHDRAWHAIEGAAGEAVADPGTILNAVLHALRIEAPTAEDKQAKCAKCQQPFDPSDTRFDGRAQHAQTPFCRRCVDLCHESTDAFHVCPICR
jgi:hypothetical protein